MGLLQTDFARRMLRWGWLQRLLKFVVPPLDKFLLRLSRGWVSTAMQTIVLMETVGAKSGKARAICTLCMPDGDDIILVGSNWGQVRHPAWLFNLRANPNARVTFRGYRGTMRARELEGAEREQMWQRLLHYNPHYQHYQDNVDRILPIVRLQRS